MGKLLLMVVLIADMALAGMAGYYFWEEHKKDVKALAKKEEEKKAKELAKNGESSVPQAPKAVPNPYLVKIIPIESILVNLAGDSGRRELRLSLEVKIEGDGSGVLDEITKKKSKIRDALLVLVTNTTYDELAGSQGKEYLKGNIKDKMNSLLTQGKVTEIFFREFELN